MKTTRIVLVLLLVLWFGTMVHAKPVGILSLEKGKVRIRSKGLDNTYKTPGKQVQVHSGDEIQTGTDTRAVIKLSARGDHIELFSITFFRLTDVSAVKQELSMPTGKLRFQVTKSLKKRTRRRFKLRTANAIIGVKGTGGTVASLDGDTSVLCESGVCTVASDAYPDVPVDVEADQVTRLRRARPPTLPLVAPPAVRRRIIAADNAAQGFQGVKFGAVIKVDPIKRAPKKKPGPQKPGTKPGGQPKPQLQPGTGATPQPSGPVGPTGGGVTVELDVEPDDPELEGPDIDNVIEQIEAEIDVLEDDIDVIGATEALIRLIISN